MSEWNDGLSDGWVKAHSPKWHLHQERKPSRVTSALYRTVDLSILKVVAIGSSILGG